MSSPLRSLPSQVTPLSSTSSNTLDSEVRSTATSPIPLALSDAFFRNMPPHPGGWFPSPFPSFDNRLFRPRLLPIHRLHPHYLHCYFGLQKHHLGVLTPLSPLPLAMTYFPSAPSSGGLLSSRLFSIICTYYMPSHYRPLRRDNAAIGRAMKRETPSDASYWVKGEGEQRVPCIYSVINF